uniref:Retrotransposon Copia-like N-terminal domain-containing protein n=1 Tax=Fagus sylvatica TaxID=28930 RepID=A0A2N9G749_FAGSY
MAPQSNSSASENAVNDDPIPSSPYYLHPSDNSSLILVPEPLTGDNFHSWFRSMDMALTIKNKLGFVDGSIREPEVNPSVLYKPTAYIIWKELQEKFSQSNGPQIFQLEKDIGIVDYDMLEKTIVLFKPKFIIAGTSAYPRGFDNARMRK